MNPDTSSPEYQRMTLARNTSAAVESARRHHLHQVAVARRRKAKRGGRR